MFPSSTWKFTSLPIKLNETGFKNFHNKFKYDSTSQLKVASFAFWRLHPVPAVNDAVMHPKAPADGKPRYLLPITASVPQRTIVVKRRPFEYFWWRTGKNAINFQSKKNRCQSWKTLRVKNVFCASLEIFCGILSWNVEKKASNIKTWDKILAKKFFFLKNIWCFFQKILNFSIFVFNLLFYDTPFLIFFYKTQHKSMKWNLM